MNVSVRHRSLIVGLILIPVAAIGMTGCVTNGDVSDELDAPTGNSQEEAPKPSETVEEEAPAPTSIPGDQNGDGKLDGWEREQLAKASYTLSDGTAIAIPSDQPLPAVVVQEIQANAAPVAQALASARGDDVGAASDQLSGLIEAKEAEIGRRIIPVSFAVVGRDGSLGWAVGQPATVKSGGFPTQEAALAYANGWAKGNTAYEVIVFQ